MTYSWDANKNKTAETIGGVNSRGHSNAKQINHRFDIVGVFTLLPPGQAGRRAEREDIRFEFWCPMGSCQLWLPRGQAHVESSLPSGLGPLEAAIGSYKSLKERIIILLALALRSAPLCFSGR